jgi:UDP-glucose 4-epimerase
MTILVTGGAGYVGSVVAEELVKQGYEVAIVDNLNQGHRQAIPKGSQFFLGDISETPILEEIFQRCNIEAVMHMAAESIVESSITNPKKCFQTNLIGGINILNTMLRYNIYQFIFSSSAAIYGEPKAVPIEESHTKAPVNSYGDSKLMFERILERYGNAYPLKHISLRYFNAAGSTVGLGEHHSPETHLIPKILNVALKNDGYVAIFGTDYPTKDGSCIRDYVHVRDIAQAHILALNKLNSLKGQAYNLGNEDGYSVIEVVNTAKRVTGVPIMTKVVARRPGDPAVLVASSKKAKEELGWRPKFTQLEGIIESAWNWMREHPNGYEQ